MLHNIEADRLRLLLLFPLSRLSLSFFPISSSRCDQSNRVSSHRKGRFSSWALARGSLAQPASHSFPSFSLSLLLSLSLVTFVNTKANLHVNVARPLQTRASAGGRSAQIKLRGVAETVQVLTEDGRIYDLDPKEINT